MARRFRHSLRRRPGGALILWFLPLPLVPAFFISLLRGRLVHALACLVAFCLFEIGALWVRQGLKRQHEYEERKLAKAPRKPRKMFGAVALAAAAFVTSWLAVGQTLVFSLVIAALAMVGCLLAYGLDPRKDKIGTLEDGLNYTSAEVLEIIQRAEEKIRAIDKAAATFNDRELVASLGRITELARRIIAGLEDDPRDLRKVRSFVNVYLDGVEKVTDGYADTMGKTGSEALLPRYRELLRTIEEVFEKQHHKLMDNDLLDLDVKMEVLMKQLRHEGVI